MQLKDTLAIVLLLSNGLLIFGILGGVGIPGLLLYARRWRQLRNHDTRSAMIRVAGLSLVHELAWAWTFFQDATTPSAGGEPGSGNAPLPHYAGLYSLGAWLCVGQLLLLLRQGPIWQQASALIRVVMDSALVLLAYWATRALFLLTIAGERPPLPDIPMNYRPLLWLELLGLVLAAVLLAYYGAWRLAARLRAATGAPSGYYVGGALLAFLVGYLSYQLLTLWKLSAYVLAGGQQLAMPGLLL